MSINFWWDTEKCDLNNKTKEHSCRACFVAEPYSTYMKMVKSPANQGFAKSCTALKGLNPSSMSGGYVIDPDGEGGLPPFEVTCNMNDKNGVGVTIINHDSEKRTLVQGCEPAGCYSRDIWYTGASLSQMAMLTRVSLHCEQFIKYECYEARLFRYKLNGWWVSRDSKKMTHWGGASGHKKCACVMTNSCADSRFGCNCDKNDKVWREDSGLLTDKTELPVKQLRFGDTGGRGEQGYHTLGKFKCYGTA
ncbi:contactin-associated protein-like 2 [Montipora foliosa]|uniref:contactin-associated protein-like 2 n=1 Tax=Montipora foliosa TaxID=591990 RepID=UPI0035F1D9C2